MISRFPDGDLFLGEVAIIGAGMTKFGRYHGSLMEMLSEASLRAIDDAGAGEKDFDMVLVANMGAGAINRQTAIASGLVDQLNLFPAGAQAIENGPASGGSAIRTGFMMIASGLVDTILITGGEKMRVAPGPVVTDFVAMMSQHDAEYIHGVTLPSLGAMLARLYMHKYGVTAEDLARIAVKNHRNAMNNPWAHLQQPVTLEGIMISREARINNPIIADPLRLYDMCPVSDGAASVVLCSLDKAKEFTDAPVKIIGSGQGTDTHAVHERPDPTILRAVRYAADQVFQMANKKRSDIHFAELHDAFTILELAQSEDSGFFEKGKAHLAVREGETEIGGNFPINPSGGLKARGHPVGATGVAQAVEIVWQLQGEAGKRQVTGAETAYAINFGGFGNNVVTHIFERC